MDSSFSFPNRRQTFRWPVTGSRQTGELRFGSKRMKVQLYDESAGGFSALCEQPAGIGIGAKGLLCAGGDWFEVCLVNIEPIGPSPIEADDGNPLTGALFKTPAKQESASEPLPEKTSPCYRLGLARLGDAFDPDTRPSYYSLAGLTCHLRQVSPGSWGVIFAGILLSILVVIVPLTSLEMLSSDAADAEIKKGSQWLDRKAVRTDTPDANQPNADNGYSPGVTRPSSPLNDKIADLRRTIRRMPGAMPFSLPEVVKQLQLTESQQKKIRELVDAAANMIKNLGNSLSNDDDKEKMLAGKNILDGTRKKVLELLDEEQKKIWRELSGEPEKEAIKDKK